MKRADIKTLPIEHSLSYGQQSQWFINKLAPDSGGYNINLSWRIDSKINISVLKESLIIISNRHPSIQTTYHEKNGLPYQQVDPNMDFLISEIDGSGWDKKQLLEFLKQEMYKPFDLEKDPKLRWTIVKISDIEYVLTGTTPHIASDLWSLMIIMNELKELYVSANRKSELILPSIKNNYTDFVDWQLQYISSLNADSDWEFWQKKLKGELPVLDLPLDYSISSNISFSNNSISLDIDGDLLISLKKLARKLRVTLNVLFQAIYMVFLHRYTAQDDIIVGTPTAGRNRKDYGGIFGYFVNIIPIRANFVGNPSFSQFLTQIRQEVKFARKHQDFPFSLLVERLQPKREITHPPIIQTLFGWEDSNAFENMKDPILTCDTGSKEQWDMGDFSMELINKTIINEFNLSCRIGSYKKCLRIFFDFDSVVFREATIKRMTTSFHTLIESIVENPDVLIEEANILPENERNKILYDWNNTETEYPRDSCIHHLFESVARRFPYSIALEFNNSQMTYEELNEKANQLANYLLRVGVKPGNLIGVCLDRSLDMIIGIIGIIKAGGAYVPVDSALPGDRIDYILNDAKASIIITQENYSNLFLESTAKVFCIDSQWGDVKHESKNNLSVVVKAENLFYVMYTSGSTGQPKGVCVTHRNVVRLVKNTNYADFDSKETFLFFCSFSFDVSIFEIWGSLLNGAKLCIFPSYIPSLEELGDYILNKNISILWLTAGIYHKMVEGQLEKLINVRQLIAGGDVLSLPHVLKALKTLKNTKLINGYGPTENTTFTCCYTIDKPEQFKSSVLIGRPISNTKVYILDKNLQPVPIGVSGELCTSGDGIAAGYLNQPEKTNEKFVRNPFSNDPNDKLYKTGDLARYLPDGNIEFLGRTDYQLKIRGFRIEPGEIELCLSKHPDVREVVVVAKEIETGEKQLVAYIISDNTEQISTSKLRFFLRQKLPDYMVPSFFVSISSFPITHNGKLNREMLPVPNLQRSELETKYSPANTEFDKILVSIWSEVLCLEQVGIHDNFFDLGGNSILMLQVFSKLLETVQNDLNMVELFEYSTIHTLSQYLEQEKPFQLEHPVQNSVKIYGKRKLVDGKDENSGIAIIGMAGRFPGADSIEELWQNLINGIESISHFSDEELLVSGMSREMIDQPGYVKSKGILKDSDLFDSHFFGFSPKQADMIDPQHRIFLECSWEALENAGYDPARYQGLIGTFGGTGYNTYRDGLIDGQSGLNSTGDFPIMIGNEKDFLCTRVAYKLNLKGPAVVNQSACSTSLVAVHSACLALKNSDCDMALAGGVSIIGSNYEGYVFQRGGILSPDGHCRPFDARGQGTVPGQGVGLVVLKRLEDALEDGDTIHAVIKGSAINNDGSLKAGYTAPGVDGQVKVIKAALDNAGVEPSSVGYIETHGTGTTLGDPIEIRALSKVYGAETDEKQFCALGSVKSNLGHLDTASGVTGLIKAVLSIKNRQLSPVVHFESPNPAINFEESPFHVTDRLMDWDAGDNPLRAGVSSFGIGGTNVHLIVEEPPKQEVKSAPETWRILPISAKSTSALKNATNNLLHFLEGSISDENCRISDIAHTLQVGRQEFQHRCIVTCKTREDAIQTIRTREPGKITSSSTTASSRPVVFMFPGQGAQYVNMAKELYLKEPIFKKEMDSCFDFLLEQQNLDIKSIVFPEEGDLESAKTDINETLYTQPILFSIEYALAKLWIAFGVQPLSMIGHSIGEYTAACISGVFSLEDALLLVNERGRLIQSLPHGDMLSVRITEEEIRPFLNDRLSIAAVNTPNRCVVSGDSEAIGFLKAQLEEMNRDCGILHTSHAFHSHMLDSILEPFREFISNLTFNAPQIPYVSNVTGDWIKKDQVIDPDYWVAHLRGTVQFSKGVKQLLQNPNIVLLEVGPGRVLRTLSVQNLEKAKDHVVVSSICPPTSNHSDLEYILSSVGRLWLHGVSVDWEKISEQSRFQRIPLPTYPFERRRHWLEVKARPRPSSEKIPNIGDWFYLPTWKQAYHKDRFSEKLELTYAMQWLIFVNQQGMGSEMAKMLRSYDQRVVEVRIGDAFSQINDEIFEINPKNRSDYKQLIEALSEKGFIPQKIVHMWTVIGAEFWGIEYFDYLQPIGLTSLIFLLQILEEKKIRQLMQIQIVTDNAQEILGNEQLSPGKSPMMALVNGIQPEYPHIFCQTVDIAITEAKEKEKTDLIMRLIKEINTYGEDQFIAFRKEYRWVQAFEKRYLEPLSQNAIQLKDGGVYLITGGLGNIGLVVAEYLAKKIRAKIALLGRSSFPSRNDWQQWIESNGSSNEISKKIEKLMQLERRGATIQILQADISDYKQTKEAVGIIENTSGEISGIFHAAGEIGQNTLHRISKITPEILDEQFKPKVQGAFVLEEVFRHKQLSFVMLFSSLSSIIGGVEYTAYAAANQFLDGFARLMDRYSTVRWITINWDGWKFDEKLNLDFLLTPEEGEEVLNRILSQNFITQLIVSTIDLFNRLSQIRSRQVIPPSEIEPDSHTSPAITSSEQKEKYVAPRNDIEHRIVKIWDEFLGIERISIHDDFFEIGGDSLMAVRLTARLEESFPGAVTEKTILQESTVSDLALAIQNNLKSQSKDSQEERLESYQSLMQMQKGIDSKRPLFLVHTGLGFVYYYIDLAKSLGKNQPVYAFQARGIKKGTEPLVTIKEMATAYIEELLDFKPFGPYLLGGSSAGGFIAFEMAKQLQKKGHQISLLTMIDTPGPVSALPRPLKDNVEIINRMFGDKLNLDGSNTELHDMSLDSLIEFVVDRVNKNSNSNDLTFDFVESCIRIARVLEKAMFDYHPEPYSGDILFFKHSESLEEFSSFPERPWIDLANQGVHVVKAPGNHYTMNINPNVSFITKQIKMRLEQTK